MGKATGNLLALMDGFLTDIRQEAKKAAAEKKATDPSEPTTHPVMKADDGTQKATEGARSSENEADVKKELGEAGITGQEDANSASSIKPSDSIGTQSQDSSEVKGNVSQPKSTKDKPPESAGHPSNSTFSEKYSSVIETGNKLLAAIAEMNKASTHEPGHMASESDKPADKGQAAKKAPPFPPKKDEKKDEKKAEEDPKLLEKRAAADKYTEDAEAGYMAAQVIAESLGMGKSAEEANKVLAAQAEQIIKFAQDDAVTLVEFTRGLKLGVTKGGTNKAAARASINKRAEGIPPELLMGAGGGDMGGGMPLGGDAGMGGGMPPGGGGGGGGAGGDEEAIIEAIAEALAAEGVSPEELAQALAESGGGGGGDMGGGMPPGGDAGLGGGGAPPPAGPPLEEEAAPAPKEDTASEGREDKKEKEAALRKKAALARKLRELVHA
jgi:hypothetical protein